MQYSVLLILLILLQVGAAAFIFFDKSWKDVGIPSTSILVTRCYICLIGHDNRLRKFQPTKLVTLIKFMTFFKITGKL